MQQTTTPIRDGFDSRETGSQPSQEPDNDPLDGQRSIGPDERRGQKRLNPIRILLHSLVLVVLGLSWILDQPIFEVTDRWYNDPIPLNGELHQLVLSLSMYGQMLGITLALALILTFDVANRGRTVIVGAVLLATGLACDVLKGTIGRERPLMSRGQTVIRGPMAHDILESRNHSFPSGHTAIAFALSHSLSTFYPQTRILVWPLAVGVGVNRVVTVRHYLSDVIAGAWLGYAVAVWIMPVGWIGRLGARVTDSLRPARLHGICWFDWEGLRRRTRRLIASPILLVVASLVMNWAGNGSTALWDRDEPRFATATREMMERRDWIVPTFNGELRPDKPILIYWLMGIAYTVFGAEPFAARFFSGVAGAGAVWLTFILGRRMFGRTCGLVAGWMLALSPMVLAESKLATADALLFCFLTSALVGLWRIYRKPDEASGAFIFWASVSLGILTKGPVAMAVPAAAVAVACLMLREYRWLAGFAPKWGIPLLLVIVVPWCVAVHAATDGDFLRLALGHHVMKRAVAPLEGHKGPPGYYLVTLLAVMAPWSWLLPWSIRHWGSKALGDPRLAFLASWAIGALVLFESVQTKLVHYFLPAYPAIAIWLSAALIAAIDGRSADSAKLNPALGRLFAGIAATLGTLGLIFSGLFLPTSAALAAAVVIVVMATGSTAAGVLFSMRRYQRSFLVMAASSVAAVLIAGVKLLPELSHYRLTIEVAQRLAEQGKPVALWQYRDPSLIYYSGKPVPVVDAMRIDPFFPETVAFLDANGPFVCPMTPAQLEWMGRDAGLSLKVIDTVAGWDLQGCRQREIHLVEVAPSEKLDEIRALAGSLKARLPETEEILLSQPNQETGANAAKRYPLSPAFASRPGSSTR